MATTEQEQQVPEAPTSPRHLLTTMSRKSIRKINTVRNNVISALSNALSRRTAPREPKKSTLAVRPAGVTKAEENDVEKPAKAEPEVAVNDNTVIRAADSTAAENEPEEKVAEAALQTENPEQQPEAAVEPSELDVTEGLHIPLRVVFSFHGNPDASELNVSRGAGVTGVSKNDLWWVAIDDETQAVGYIPASYVVEEE